ncbi:MAG TPA: Arm DNA-binding domain-containing protein, partial [Candidatus Obscuribacterales bacterium]
MAEERMGFTKDRIEKLPIPEPGKRKDYYDSGVRELLVQVTGAGTKTFYVRRKISGVSTRIKIGRYPSVSVENARKKAREILGDIEKGINPQDVKRAEREELTLAELFQHYLEQYAMKRCTTWKDMELNFGRYVGELRDRKLSTIRKTDVQSWVNRLGDKIGPHTANRNYDNLRAVFSWGIKRGYFEGGNPCT